MSTPLVFMMGQSPTFLPIDRRYAPNHMWAKVVDGGFQLGLSAFAVKLLGDVTAIRWSITPGQTLEANDPVGFIEGSKATSDLFSPLFGEVTEINPDPVARPGMINSNLYDDAWLLRMTTDDDQLALLLSPKKYAELLGQVWPAAQRMLKGQASQSEDDSHADQ